MDSIIGLLILASLFSLCLVAYGAKFPITKNVRKGTEKPQDRPEHVSWREIDEPLLYGWEWRFRQSIGPIPNDIEALHVLSREHMAYGQKYNRDALEIGGCDMARYMYFKDRRDEHEREGRKFEELYNQEVRKFYLLAPEDPIGLPMKYKLPEKGPSNRVHTA